MVNRLRLVVGGLMLLGAIGATGTPPVRAEDETPAATRCAVGDGPVCTLAALVGNAVRAGDIDALLDRVTFAPYRCPAAPGAPAATLCNDDRTGPQPSGFLTGFLSAEAAVYSRPQLRDVLRDWFQSARAGERDGFGDGAPRLFAVGCTDAHITNSGGCGSDAVLVVSAIVRTDEGGAFRQQLMLHATTAGGEARIVDAVFAVLEGDDLDAAMRGGAGTIFTADSADTGVYVPWPSA